MSDRQVIKARIRQLLCEELDRRVDEAQQRRPRLCAHNRVQSLDSRKEIYGEVNDAYNRIAVVGSNVPVSETIGLCMLGASDIEQWKGAVCEDDMDAMRCPYFSPTKTKGDIWDDFCRDISDAGWVSQNMPAIRELLWVVGDHPLGLPWWKDLWYRWVLRIKVVPALPVSDPDLLPPGLDEPPLLEMQDGAGRLVQIRRSKDEDVCS